MFTYCLFILRWGRQGFATLIFGALALFGIPVSAQISVTFPVPRVVIQRDASNQAALWIIGQCPLGTTHVEVMLTATTPGWGANSGAFYTIDGNPANGSFRGTITASGGWYTVAIRAMNQGTVLAATEVTPVGIGEVFVVAGQSNGQGVMPNRSTVAPADERVVAVPHFNLTDTIRLPLPPVFEQMTVDGIIGPRGQTSWCWGRLGDLLAQRFNVPVAFYNTAWSGTSVRNWRESITVDSTASSGFDYFRPKMPYGNLKRVLQDYVPLTGLRAVLWHQGEQEYYDIDRMAPNYYADLRTVIQQSRLDANYADLPWLVARATIDNNTVSLYPTRHYDPVWNQQNQVIQDTYRVFAGPDTDTIQVPRLDGVHLIGPGLLSAANAWSQAMDANFFNVAAPLLPKPVEAGIDLAIQAAVKSRVIGVGQDMPLTITVTNEGGDAASGIRIRCQMPANLLCTNAGGMALNDGMLLGAVANLLPGASESITIWVRPLQNGTYRVAAEIIKANQLDIDSRPNSSIADGQDDLVWVDFRTTEVGPAFLSPPSYNSVLLPSLLGNQPLPVADKADLSLRAVVNQLVAPASKPITVSLVVTNSGGLAASNVNVYCVLPAGVSSFISPNMSVGSGGAYGTITSLPANSSATIWFQVHAPLLYEFAFKAQIMNASPADPDSTPGNGYDNGEDDTATARASGR